MPKKKEKCRLGEHRIKREPEIGDYIIVTNPYNWRKDGIPLGIPKEAIDILTGTVGRIVKIYTKKTQDLPYVIDVLKIDTKIYQYLPSFEGRIWCKEEFEVITKDRAFMELW